MSPPEWPILLGAGVLVVSLSGLAIVSRLWPAPRPGTGAHRAGPRPPAATFQPVPDGTVWRACPTTTCAHLTTRHTPDGDGRRCQACGHLTAPPYDEGAHAGA